MSRFLPRLTAACIALVTAACGPLGQRAGDGGRPDGPRVEEVCDNGLDDDGNGQVDETCACLTGAVQRCFVGNPALAGVGVCTWGRQRCVGNVELGTWTACGGYGTATQCADPGGGDETRRRDGGNAGGDDGGAAGDGSGGGDQTRRDGGAGGDGSGGGDQTRRDGGGNGGGDDGGFFWRPDGGGAGGDDGGSPWWPDSGTGGGDDGGFFWRRDGGPGGDSGTGGGDDGGPRTDSGTGRDSGGGDDGGRSCTCIPGQSRWCDTPTACAWGRQQCLPDGRWGTCAETTLRPAGCSGYFYNRNCCVAAGQCCQNFPYNNDSVGSCAGILMCTP